MNTRLLKTAIYVSGLLCFYGFLAIRIEPLYNLVLSENKQTTYWDDNKHGELYYFNNIWDFREEIPPVEPKYQYSEEHPELEEADILTYGDSFLDFSRHTQLSKRLNDSLEADVFYEYSVYPQKHLANEKYENQDQKLLIYTRTERWIPITFGEDAFGDVLDNTPSRKKDNTKSSFLVRKSKKLLDMLFYDRSEELYSALLQRSYVFGFINSAISTLKFRWFGYVSTFTPKYTFTEDRPWLFFHDQLGDTKSSYYYQFTDDEIKQIASKIHEFSEDLNDHYNLKLVFMPVPSKFTIYHDLIDPETPYNGFLPRLFEQLDKKGVHYVNLYHPYLNADEYVFYGTDEHWTEEGVSIATHELTKELKQLGVH